MALYELKLPEMGESVAEATVTNWLKSVGDTIEADEAVVEVATDKVDSEVPSEVSGVLKEIRFSPNEVVKVGEVLAIVETEQTSEVKTPKETKPEQVAVLEEDIAAVQQSVSVTQLSDNQRFYSPLVRNIAQKEGIGTDELAQIKGTGLNDRVTKTDILDYLSKRKSGDAVTRVEAPQKVVAPPVMPTPTVSTSTALHPDDQVIPMSRMGKIIAEHMLRSKQTSPHVQSFTEADVTRIWNWRNRVKSRFEKRENQKFTFTPIFMSAVAKALQDYPMMNISVEGDTIIKKSNINLGMATALPDGNLIVPVIKNADRLSLTEMAKVVNDLAQRARNNQLKPDEVMGGTYTVTNIGSFGNVFGTPIINQPQVGILALGAIRKVPAVIETPTGDAIGIRYKMMLSHSYDHRVVNGALGGMFVQRVAEYLEKWDTDREV